jgi:hypothetical protein
VKTSWGWKSTFLIGTIACVGTAYYLFGLSTLTVVIAGIQFSIAFLDFVFGSARGTGKHDEHWAQGQAKRLLNTAPLLKLATVTIWLVLGVLAFRLVTFTLNERHLVTVAGRVEEADGSLASNASVTLSIGTVTQKTLATDGRFSFRKIDLQGQHPNAAVIEALWNGKRASKTIDLTSGELGNQIVRLPLGHAPFRIRYFLLGGHAIDFFLKGKMDAEWEKELSGQPYIVPNVTMKMLSEDMTKFSEPFKAQLLFAPVRPGSAYSQKAYNSEERLADKFSGFPIFVGTDASPAAASMGRGASREDIESLFDSTRNWHVRASPYSAQPTGTDDLIFWRFATPADLQSFANDRYAGHLVSWLQYATRSNFPKDFCIVSMNAPGCDPDRNQNLAVGIRTVHLRIAVIENLSSKAIRLGDFGVRENLSNLLRSREDDQAQLGHSELQSYRWFSPEDLRPSETIAVPLEITFKYDEDKNWDLVHLEKDSDSKSRDDVRSLLLQYDTVRFHYYSNGSEQQVGAPADSLIRLMDRPEEDFGLRKEYIYGPSTRLEALEVDDAVYPVRQFDPRLVVIRSGNASGSCPFVYVHSGENDTWIREGRILYGANGPKKESFDSLKLGKFDGRVMLREQEPETTFVKTIYLSARDAAGKKRLYDPTNWDSIRRNREYVELRQGESIELRFPISEGMSELKLFVEGFYQPTVRTVAR